VLVVAVLAPPAPVAAQARAGEPAAVALAALAAVNAGNPVAFATLSTEAVSLTILPGAAGAGVEVRGREAVAGVWRQAAAGGLQARAVGPPQAAGARVMWTVRYTTPALRAQGQAMQAELEASIPAGRIEALTARVTGAIPLAQYEALSGGVGLPRTGTGGRRWPESGMLGAGGAAAALALAAALTRRRTLPDPR
jgi:hypothetical protein